MFKKNEFHYLSKSGIRGRIQYVDHITKQKRLVGRFKIHRYIFAVLRLSNRFCLSCLCVAKQNATPHSYK